MAYQYLYGPVVSRRLGMSLGVDLTPGKICTFNCVYCECGRNSRLTVERKEYAPAGAVLSELKDYLGANPTPDTISFSGSGEPTLHAGLGGIIRWIKENYPGQRVAVFTNSSLLHLKEVRDGLMAADLVLPSLDGATRDAYVRIDRPHPSLDLDNIIGGIAAFTREFRASGGAGEKQVWLEIFIVEGINTDDENAARLRDAVLKINPDRVQLNSLDRPGTEKWVRQAPLEVLESVSRRLDFPGTEIIAGYRAAPRKGPAGDAT